MCCGFQGSWGAKMGKDAPTLKKRQERREAAVHRERERVAETSGDQRAFNIRRWACLQIRLGVGTL